MAMAPRREAARVSARFATFAVARVRRTRLATARIASVRRTLDRTSGSRPMPS
jgi:hypothetical protein